MAFTNNFRIERIYFEKLKSNIDILKSYIEAGATGEALELLKNSVDVNGAILLLYRNLGEAWAELADLIQKTQKDLKDLDEKTEAYHDELNERIDEVNNYLMALIRELDARLQVVEQDLATMNRNKFYDLIEDDGVYSIEKDGETVSFDDIKADADFPHDVILRYDNGTSVTELEIREFTDSRIDFYSIGLTDSDKTVKEILVSIADSGAVTYSENTLENPLYTFGTGLSLDSNNELSVDFNTVQAKLTEGTGIDIDSNNEISVDTSVIQEKLTEGFGIDIDSNNEIKVDTAQVQEKLIAGQNITLTPDSTDPTKTVISATDTTYSGGTGIDIDSNNVISADTSVLQEKLVAGSGIAIDPNTNEILNTAQGATYTAGDGINIDSNNAIFNQYDFPNFVTDLGSIHPSSWTDSINQPQDCKRCYFNLDSSSLHNLELAKFIETYVPTNYTSYVSSDTSFTDIALKGIIILRFILEFKINNHIFKLLLINHTITVRKSANIQTLNIDYSGYARDLYNLNGITGKTFSNGALTLEIGAVFDNIDYGSTHYNGIINKIKASFMPYIHTIQ